MPCFELLSVYFDNWGRGSAGSSGGGVSLGSFIEFFSYFSAPLILLLEMFIVFFVICLIYIQVEGLLKRNKRKKKLEKRKLKR